MITSLNNDTIKYFLKLKHKKYRDLYNEYLIEGDHLIKEAYKNNTIVELIVLKDIPLPYDLPYIYVSNEIMKELSDLDNFNSYMAVCKKKKPSTITGSKILLLDNIQDPGNLGTIIRSSKAFNIDTLVLSNDTVDLYNSKVLRSTQGIYNYLNIVRMDLKEAIFYLKEQNIPIYGTNVSKGVNVKSINNTEKYALIMGSEGKGLKKQLEQLCDKNIYIPINKSVESLNVAIAASILLYELNGE